MEIRTKDYGRQYRELWPELEPALRATFDGDDPILGDAVADFEQELARFHGVRHAMGTGSGTDALILALRALDLDPGAGVLTCAHTFPGVVSAIVQAGATPRLVEPDPRTGLLDPERVGAAITPAVRVLLAVHLYGHPVDLDTLQELCREHDLVLVEDCAQAHGATWRNRPVGSFGRVAATSFHPSKNLGAFGDGGAVITDDATLAARIAVSRNLGKRGKYEFVEIAPNTKLDTLQAVLLRVKLRHLEGWLARRRRLAQLYLDGLSGVGDLILPAVDPRATHAWHLFVVRTARRDALRDHLAAQEIRTSLHYPTATPDQPAFQSYFANQPFPLAREWALRGLTLPLSHEHDDAEIEHVVASIRHFFGRSPREA